MNSANLANVTSFPLSLRELAFIIESLRASLPSTQEDPKAAAPVSPAAAYKPAHGGYPG